MIMKEKFKGEVKCHRRKSIEEVEGVIYLYDCDTVSFIVKK